MGSIGDATPDKTIDQSGLSTGYTSLATDFNTYIASGPTHNNLQFPNVAVWGSSMGTTTGNFDFALGGPFVVEAIALWNIGGDDPTNISFFRLLADDNAAFSSPTDLGSFMTDTNTGPVGSVLPEVYTFTPTLASFVRMEIIRNNNSQAFTSFGEAAFEVAVPTPTSLPILLAVVGTMILERRPRIA